MDSHITVFQLCVLKPAERIVDEHGLLSLCVWFVVVTVKDCSCQGVYFIVSLPFCIICTYTC